MNLKTLFLIHAALTGAAAVVLVAAPAMIPGTVSIPLQPEQYLLCYFLAAAEGAIAILSFYSRSLQDKTALQLIVRSFIFFHVATGVLEGYALMQGTSSRIVGNIVLRAVVVGLFYYYGPVKEYGSAEE